MTTPELPHPFKKGDRVMVHGQRGTVIETSWQRHAPMCGVKIDVDTSPGLYRFNARFCRPLSAVDQLGEIET